MDKVSPTLVFAKKVTTMSQVTQTFIFVKNAIIHVLPALEIKTQTVLHAYKIPGLIDI